MTFVFANEPSVPGVPTTVIDAAAIKNVLWFFGHGGNQPGRFWELQLEAFAVADRDNFQRLYASFPSEAFWFDVVKNRDDGVMLALRALDSIGALP